MDEGNQLNNGCAGCPDIWYKDSTPRPPRPLSWYCEVFMCACRAAAACGKTDRGCWVCLNCKKPLAPSPRSLECIPGSDLRELWGHPSWHTVLEGICLTYYRDIVRLEALARDRTLRAELWECAHMARRNGPSDVHLRGGISGCCLACRRARDAARWGLQLNGEFRPHYMEVYPGRRMRDQPMSEPCWMLPIGCRVRYAKHMKYFHSLARYEILRDEHNAWVRLRDEMRFVLGLPQEERRELKRRRITTADSTLDALASTRASDIAILQSAMDPAVATGLGDEHSDTECAIQDEEPSHQREEHEEQQQQEDQDRSDRHLEDQDEDWRARPGMEWSDRLLTTEGSAYLDRVHRPGPSNHEAVQRLWEEDVVNGVRDGWFVSQEDAEKTWQACWSHTAEQVGLTADTADREEAAWLKECFTNRDPYTRCSALKVDWRCHGCGLRVPQLANPGHPDWPSGGYNIACPHCGVWDWWFA